MNFSFRRSPRRARASVARRTGVAGTDFPAHRCARASISLPTLGGQQFWTDRFLHAGWRIQESTITGRARLLDPWNVRHSRGDFETCRAAFERIRAAQRIEPYRGHLVILVHGLGRTRRSVGRLGRALRQAGYQVAAIGYASTRRSVARNADDLADLMENLEGVDRVSFVTHSLGGLVVRDLLARPAAPWRNRIAVNALVMTAPPSRGSRMADILQYVPPINLILWRGLLDSRSRVVAALPAPDVPFAIIAAGRGGKGWNPVLTGDDDLIVSVAETHLDGAAAWMRVDGIHALVLNYPASLKAIIAFIENRCF